MGVKTFKSFSRFVHPASFVPQWHYYSVVFLQRLKAHQYILKPKWVQAGRSDVYMMSKEKLIAEHLKAVHL